MKVICFAFLVFVSCASASPSRYGRYDSDYWDETYTGAGAFAGGGGAYAGGGYFPGAFAGAGSFMPFPFFWPVPGWSLRPVYIKPWYKGDHVCKEEKVANKTDEMKEFFGEDDSDFNYSHRSQECRLIKGKFVCFTREQSSNGEFIMKKTTYFCCDGYVRNDYGAGCIKKDQGPAGQVPGQAPPSQVRENEKFRYNFVPFQGSSNVEGVPAQ